jgi:hypothetical protein
LLSSYCLVLRRADLSSDKSWVVLKLFYHEFWMGWSTETTPWFLVRSIVFVFGSFVLWLVLARFWCKGLSCRAGLVGLLVTCTVLFVVFWLSFSLGRQHVVQLFRDRQLNPYEGSAAVAILYNNSRALVPDLIGFLEERASNGSPTVDLDIDEWVASNRHPAFVFAPSLFQHWGLSSSIAHKAGKHILPTRLLEFKQSLTWRERYF